MSDLPATSQPSPMEQRARRIARGGAATFATSLLLKGTSVIASIVIARQLGPFQLGEWSLVTYVTGLAWLFIELGTGTAAVRVISAARATSRERAENLAKTYVLFEITAALPVLLVFATSATWLANDFYGDPVLLPLFWLSIATLFISTLVSSYAALLQAYERIRLLARLNLVLGFANSLLLVGFVLVWGLVGGFAASAVANFLQVVVYVVTFKDARPLSWKGWRPRWIDIRELLGYALPTFISGGFLVVFNWLGATLLTAQLGADALGHYTVAQRVAFVALYIPTAVVVPFFPMASGLYQDDPQAFRRTLHHTLRYVLLILFPVTLVASAFARLLITSLYGDPYAEAAQVVPITAGTALLAGFMSPAILVFYVTGAMRRQAAVSIAAFAAGTAALFAMIPRLGVAGFAWAAIAYYGVMTGFAPLLQAGRSEDPKYARFAFSALVLAGTVCMTGLLVLNLDASLANILALAVSATVVLAIYTRVLSDRDRSFLRKLVREAFRSGDERA